MDFFESQDIAKRNTGRLILLFSLAVLSLVLITNILVMAVLGFLSFDSTSLSESGYRFNWEVFVLVSIAVVMVIVFGSLYKLAALAGGGARIAEMLDGRLLLPETKQSKERQLLNVVEEMAIASGTPVPPVYLLEESGINAFAAGYTPGDAVIGVTRGAIDTLNRDELQGVIAHEFSHILHGDMRINIRLIAILHGILILGILGYHLMRSGSYSRRSKDSGGLVFLGLGLLVIGYVGTFFGNLIKAAVSRQREFLADASAVQYTRNPGGIAGALMRIATHERRSYLDNPNGMEISHALFEEGAFMRLRNLYATHPPIEHRIRAILPNWDGRFELSDTKRDFRSTGDRNEPRSDERRDRAAAILTGVTGVLVADSLMDHIGQPGVEQLATARRLLEEIPDFLLDAAREPSSARALVYLMVMNSDEQVRQSQLEFLRRSADTGIIEELASLLNNKQAIDQKFRLVLLSIALQSLRQLSRRQFQLFRVNLNTLITIDNRIHLFEWALSKIVNSTLGPIFDRESPRPLGHKDIADCTEALEILFSLLAYADRNSQVDPESAFSHAEEKLGRGQLRLIDRSELSFEKLDRALELLSELKPLQKPAVLKACVACIMADGSAGAIEVELLRAIGLTLDCPTPPLTSD